MPNQSFLSRVHNNEILIADGATGTNFIARDLPSGTTPETWVMEKPEQVIQLHKDFIDAGANIILTSTFNATPLRLRGTSLEGKSDLVNRHAVDEARTAIGSAQVYIAGSLGPVGQLLKPYGPLTFDEVKFAYTKQAEALVDAGVDLLVIETQFDLNEVKAAIHGVREVSGLPLVASLSYDRGRRTMMGISPTQAANELNDLPVDFIGINCGHSLDENLQNLVETRKVTSKPIWFKPNAGLPHLDASGQTVYGITPREMGAQAPSWLAEGAQIIGGCCGTSPEHLSEIARQVTHLGTKSSRQ
jgi:5-methyltetrahydrofolate--homocysteine methyltransferase